MGHFIEVEKGVKVYAEDVGKGQPVVFIHGWPFNHKIFERQTTDLAQNGFRFIGIDLRGFGNSDTPWHGYDYDTAASDVKTIVDHLELDNFVLAGFSTGGAIAIRYLSKYGEQGIDKLLLMSTAASQKDFTNGAQALDVDEIIGQIKKDRPAFIANFAAKFFAQEKSAEFQNWFQSIALTCAVHSTIHSAAALRDENLTDELAGITLPTALFHGKHDQISPYKFGEELANKIPNAVLTTFDHSGHSLNMDEQDRFNSEMISFLTGSAAK